jgi:hypothetical protein
MFFKRSKTSQPSFMPGRDQLLDRAHAAVRLRELDAAESFILENGAAIWQDAACLNVLGLIAEARGDWRKARRLWGRAARANKCYQPAWQNLRRYFELFQFGRSASPVAFGDDAA